MPLSSPLTALPFKVLVIAPRFPAINQTWMDTYLEQLSINGVSFNIYSSNKSPGAYQQKVDRLGLRDFVLQFSLYNKVDFLKALLQVKSRFSLLCKALAVGRDLKAEGAGFGASFFKAAYFAVHNKVFKECSVIHAHEEIAAYEFVHLSKVTGLPLVVTFHGLPPEGVGQLASVKRTILYNHADRVIVNTEFAKKQVAALGCPEDKIAILPQGLPVEDFCFNPAKPPASGKPLELLTVGRYQRDKGQAYVLIALKRLIDQGVLTHYHLVGVGDKGRSRLEKMVKQLQLDQHVSFHQDLSDQALKALYHQAHLFVLPSLSSKNGSHEETQGVVLQEAQASGCLVIATNVGGIPECIHDHSDALLIKDRSSRALVEAINFYVDHPSQWPQFQKSARDNVEKNFSSTVVGLSMKSILLSSGARG